MKRTATRKGVVPSRKGQFPRAPAKSEPAPGIGAPNTIGYCPTCQQRRYSLGGRCLVCGAKAQWAAQP